MHNRFTACLILLPALVAVPAAPMAWAIEVFRWIDADGTVHFSQWAPGASEPEATTVTVDEGATSGIGGDVYPIEEQAKAMAELWAEIEQQRTLRLKQRQQAAPAVVHIPEAPADALWPLWRPDREHRPHRPRPPSPQPPEPSNPPSLPYLPPGEGP